MRHFVLIPIVIAIACSMASAQVVSSKTAPPFLRYQWEDAGISYRAKVTPGVAKSGQFIEIILEISSILTTPDPQFGDRKPIDDAQLQAVIYPLPVPSQKAKGEAHATQVVGRKMIKMFDKGSYGLHVTPTQPGIYGVDISGQIQNQQPIQARFTISVDTWPIPDTLKSSLPAPKNKPKNYASADLTAGKAICDQYCMKAIKWASPQGAVPTYLASGPALSYANDKLLELFIPADRQLNLRQLEKADVLAYLRSLHMQVGDLFPQASSYIVKDYTIDEHGKNRLKESLKTLPSKQLMSMTVVTLFKGKNKDGPKFVPQIPRLLVALKPKDKLGYIVITTYPGQSDGAELLIAMDSYFKITAVTARSKTGRINPSFVKNLNSFKGQGRFNDPRSIKRGSRSLKSSFTSIYLSACEAATMYVREENDRFAFESAMTD